MEEGRRDLIFKVGVVSPSHLRTHLMGKILRIYYLVLIVEGSSDVNHRLHGNAFPEVVTNFNTWMLNIRPPLPTIFG